MAQWKRAGPITQRSVDRNYALLIFAINYSFSDLLYEQLFLFYYEAKEHLYFCNVFVRDNMDCRFMNLYIGIDKKLFSSISLVKTFVGMVMGKVFTRSL